MNRTACAIILILAFVLVLGTGASAAEPDQVGPAPVVLANRVAVLPPQGWTPVVQENDVFMQPPDKTDRRLITARVAQTTSESDGVDRYREVLRETEDSVTDAGKRNAKIGDITIFRCTGRINGPNGERVGDPVSTLHAIAQSGGLEIVVVLGLPPGSKETDLPAEYLAVLDSLELVSGKPDAKK